jgi:hypothetical protein
MSYSAGKRGRFRSPIVYHARRLAAVFPSAEFDAGARSTVESAAAILTSNDETMKRTLINAAVLRAVIAAGDAAPTALLAAVRAACDAVSFPAVLSEAQAAVDASVDGALSTADFAKQIKAFGWACSNPGAFFSHCLT